MISTEELTDVLTSKDGLLTNMLISGNTQGIAQLVRSSSSALDILRYFSKAFNTRTEFGTRRRCQKVYPFIKEVVPLFHGRKIKIQRD